jgi:hypothetical protein
MITCCKALVISGVRQDTTGAVVGLNKRVLDARPDSPPRQGAGCSERHAARRAHSHPSTRRFHCHVSTFSPPLILFLMAAAAALLSATAWWP